MFIAWLWFSPNNLISVCTDYWKIHKVSHVFFTNIECLWSQSSLCIFGYLNWWKKKCSLKEKGAKLRLQLNYQYVYCVHMPLLSTLSFAMSLRHFFLNWKLKIWCYLTSVIIILNMGPYSNVYICFLVYRDLGPSDRWDPCCDFEMLVGPYDQDSFYLNTPIHTPERTLGNESSSSLLKSVKAQVWSIRLSLVKSLCVFYHINIC